MEGLIEYVGFDRRYYAVVSDAQRLAVEREAIRQAIEQVGTRRAERLSERQRFHAANMDQLALDILAAKRAAREARFPERGLPAGARVLVEPDRLVSDLEQERWEERKAFWEERRAFEFQPRKAALRGRPWRKSGNRFGGWKPDGIGGERNGEG